MRQIKVIEHISLDGVMQQSADENNFPYPEWTAPYRTPAGREMVTAAFGTRFDLILGRRTYDLWSGFWPGAPACPLTDSFNGAIKNVATHHPESLSWGPFHAIGPDVTADIRALKQQDGPQLLLAGSSSLASLVLTHGLADELAVIIYPVVLGTGKRLFAEGIPAQTFELLSSNTTPTGIVFNVYKSVGALIAG